MNISLLTSVRTFTTIAQMVVHAETMTAVYNGDGAIIKAESASGRTAYEFILTPSGIGMKINRNGNIIVNAHLLPGGWVEAESTPEGEDFVEKINALSR